VQIIRRKIIETLPLREANFLNPKAYRFGFWHSSALAKDGNQVSLCQA
jgi:hypothetical protein